MNEESELDEFAPWLVAIITLVGGFLRVLLLGTKGMWLDETFSVWLAGHTIPDILHWIVRVDQHPPLYYLLLHFWIAHYGDTAYYARLFSVLFGTITIPVIFLIGKRISGMVVGLAAAVLLALSPFNIYFAQETRMYTFLMFNAAVAIYALVRLLTDERSLRPIGSQFRDYLRAWRTSEPVDAAAESREEFSYEDKTLYQSGWRGWIRRHRWLPIQAIETDLAWVVFVLFSAAAMLSHNTAVFFLLATNIYVLGLMLYQRIKKPASPPPFLAPSLGNWVKVQIGIFLLWSPWIVSFIRQSSGVYRQFWILRPDFDIVTQALRALLNASAKTQISQVMTWILCALLCLGLVYYRKKLSIFLFLAALFTIPVLGELIVSLRRPIFLDKTLLWITIPLLLLLAAGIAQLKFRLLMIAMLGVVATNYLFSTGDIYHFVQKEDWSTPAGYVAYFAEKDDLVLFNSAMVQIPFDYYFKSYEDKYSLQVEKQGVPDMFNRQIPEPIMTESNIPELLSLLSGHDRVWLVYSHNSYTDPDGIVPRTIAAQKKLVKERDFFGGRVQLYETP
jgi:mannosyltransferase